MVQKPWFPDALEGGRVVLRRHVPENVAAFRRWYADPEIARLARYQATPMRQEEIERFFAARVVGPDTLAMAIHERGTDRLVGTCAFSQLDGDNGSALYHITIGEADRWGQGFGTEATQLMVDHAFGTLGLHRIALYVFEFNERAIRAYRRCGFVIEGRSRESIWRDGRWWDELAMSVLESDWQAARAVGEVAASSRLPAAAAGSPGAAASPLPIAPAGSPGAAASPLPTAPAAAASPLPIAPAGSPGAAASPLPTAPAAAASPLPTAPAAAASPLPAAPAGSPGAAALPLPTAPAGSPGPVTPVADALPVAVTPVADALPVAVAADGEAGAPVEAGASQRLLRTIGWRR